MKRLSLRRGLEGRRGDLRGDGRRHARRHGLRRDEAQVIVVGRYLVTVKGSGVEEADLRAYTGAIDYAGLEKK